MKKILMKIYCVVIVFCLGCMGVLVFFQDNQNINEANIGMPKLWDDGKLNVNILDEMEGYVIKNFGFRNELLEVYTYIQDKVFHTSALDSVIVGEDGYLFLEETSLDYSGKRVYSNREIFQIVHTIELMSEYVKTNGGEFVFVVAPNKNSICEKMPYNYISSTKESLTNAVFSQLSDDDYVNVFNLLKNTENSLYYMTDSHWNNQGARLVYCAIMNHFGKEYDDFSTYSLKETMIKGDLYQMLYPKKDVNEISYVYDKEKLYSYVTKTRSVEEPYIVSHNVNAMDSLLMFRDSFANNLIPFFSDAFQYATYDKNVVYNLFQMEEYNSKYVIAEIAERNLILLQEKSPLFMAPKRNALSMDREEEFVESFGMAEKEDYIFVEGTIATEVIEDDSLIYLEVGDQFYELTPQKVDDSYGFVGCIPTSELSNVSVWVTTANSSIKHSNIQF